MASKAEERACGATARPEVGGVVKHHGFNGKAKTSKKIGHHLLAAGILRGDGGTGDQILGKVKHGGIRHNTLKLA